MFYFYLVWREEKTFARYKHFSNAELQRGRNFYGSWGSGSVIPDEGYGKGVGGFQHPLLPSPRPCSTILCFIFLIFQRLHFFQVSPGKQPLDDRSVSTPGHLPWGWKPEQIFNRKNSAATGLWKFWLLLEIRYPLFSSVNSMCCFCTADNAARQDRKGNNREKTHRRSGKQDGWELSLLFRGVVKIGFALLWPCYYKQRIFRHLTCIVLLFTTVAARVFPPKCAARVFPPICAVRVFPPKCAVRVFPPLYTACVFLQFSSSLIGRDKLATHKLGTVIFYSTEKLTIIYGSFISG